MTHARVRRLVALPALAGVAALLLWALAGLPDFGKYRGPYGYVLNKQSVPERHMTNAVTATVFDFRGLDTLGEEFILFAAVTGVVLLLRERSKQESGEEKKEEEPEVPDRVESDALRLSAVLAIGAALLIGIWLIAFANVTPGGGFQGGVVVAGAVLLVYTGINYAAWRRVSNEELLDPGEGLGVGSYVAVGIAALVSGLPFLHNLIGAGQTGTLLSGGSITLLNWGTAIEVAAANVLLCSEFLQQYIVPLARGRR